MCGIVIAGTHSGCGKTTVTLGILAALKEKGLNVRPFKAGPDFIDAGLHRVITGRTSRNLDLWMCGDGYVRECFRKYSVDADISVVEGVMGLYDGKLSTAHVAAVLDLPVILIVDAYGIAESAGAVVRGFVDFGIQNADNSPISPLKLRGDWGVTGLQTPNSKLQIAGVIFNRVASENHYKRLKDSVKDMHVFGCLPRDTDFEIPHRHLGLTVAEENPMTEKNIQKLADVVLKYIDIEGIRQLAMDNRQEAKDKRQPMTYRPSPIASIAVAYDKAFCFYYEDNLDLLREAGAEIVYFSPLTDSKIPDTAHAVYIGGGYPELYADALGNNESMLKAVHTWALSGRPLYAECGGLMYLSDGVYGFNGDFHKMAGVFPFKTKMTKTSPHLGYREILMKEDCIIGKEGNKLRGHEFHYSELLPKVFGTNSELLRVYSLKDGEGNDKHDEGYKYKNVLASYIHVHFGSTPNIAGNFINFLREQ